MTVNLSVHFTSELKDSRVTDFRLITGFLRILNQHGLDCKEYLYLSQVELQRVEYYQGILQDQQAHEQQFCLPAATSPNSTPEPCLSDVGRLIESSNSQKGSLHPPHQECISDAPTQQPLELVPSSPQGWSSNLPQSPAQFIPLQEFANEPPHCLTLCNTAAGLCCRARL